MQRSERVYRLDKESEAHLWNLLVVSVLFEGCPIPFQPPLVPTICLNYTITMQKLGRNRQYHQSPRLTKTSSSIFLEKISKYD